MSSQFTRIVIGAGGVGMLAGAALDYVQGQVNEYTVIKVKVGLVALYGSVTLQCPPDRVAIRGTVRRAGGGVGDVTVRLRGHAQATTTTYPDGTYAFPGLAPYLDYIVIPSVPDYHDIDVVNRSYPTLGQDVGDADFTLTRRTHTIAGTIQCAAVGRDGVLVTLNGGPNGTRTTANGGVYAFTNLPEGEDYTVTPTVPDYHDIDADDRSYPTLVQAVDDADFTLTRRTHTIAGTIRSAGVGRDGVPVTLTGGPNGATNTANGGAYDFPDLPEGEDYTVTPTVPDHHDIDVGAHQYDTLVADVGDADFTLTLRRYIISGSIRSDSRAPLDDITVTLQPGPLTTVSNKGRYAFPPVDAGQQYTVSADSDHYAFTDVTQGAPLAQDWTNANLVGAKKTYSISGNVSYAGPGRVVRLRIGGLRAETDDLGDYEFTDLEAGESYKVDVTPHQHHAPDPTSQTIDDLRRNEDHVDFGGLWHMWTISGTIQDDQGADLDGLAVALTGPVERQAVSNHGQFTFQNVPGGSDYSITSSLAHHDFDIHEIAVLKSDVTGVALVGTLRVHRVSGHVSYANATTKRVTLSLAGGPPMTAETNAQGRYVFPALPEGGSYTVTPQPGPHTPNPLQVNVPNLHANVDDADFGGAWDAWTISGQVRYANGTAANGARVTLSGAGNDQKNIGGNATYDFPNLPGGNNFTVTPSWAHHTFVPPSLTFNGLAAAQPNQDFVATRNLWNISGDITDFRGNAINVGWTVTLGGDGAGVVAAAGANNYAFPAQNGGGSYTVTIAAPGYAAIEPTSYAFNPLQQHETTTHFRLGNVRAGMYVDVSNGRTIYLNAEMRDNIAGLRGPEHHIPIDVLFVAADYVAQNPNGSQVQEQAPEGTKHVYLFRCGGNYMKMVVRNDNNGSFRTMITCYRVTAGALQRELRVSNPVFEGIVNNLPDVRVF